MPSPSPDPSRTALEDSPGMNEDSPDTSRVANGGRTTIYPDPTSEASEARVSRHPAPTTKRSTRSTHPQPTMQPTSYYCKPCCDDLCRRMPEATDTWRFRLFRRATWRRCRDVETTHDRGKLPEKCEKHDCRKGQAPQDARKQVARPATTAENLSKEPSTLHLHAAEDFPCLSWITFAALPPGSTVRLDRPA